MNFVIETRLIVAKFFMWSCRTRVQIAHFKILMIFVFKRQFNMRTPIRISNQNSFCYSAYIDMSGAAKTALSEPIIAGEHLIAKIISPYNLP